MKIIHENELRDACRAALEAYNDAKPKDGIAVLGVKPLLKHDFLEGLVLVFPEGRETTLVTVPMVGISREDVAPMDAWEAFFAHVPYGTRVLSQYSNISPNEFTSYYSIERVKAFLTGFTIGAICFVAFGFIWWSISPWLFKAYLLSIGISLVWLAWRNINKLEKLFTITNILCVIAIITTMAIVFCARQ